VSAGTVGSGKTAMMACTVQACASAKKSRRSQTTLTKWTPNYCALGRAGAGASAGSRTGGGRTPRSARNARSISRRSPTCAKRFPDLDLGVVESGGGQSGRQRLTELADLTIYVIDVAAGDKSRPRAGPPASPAPILLVINKIDLEPHVARLVGVMERDAKRCAARGPFVFANLPHRQGVDEIVRFIQGRRGV